MDRLPRTMAIFATAAALAGTPSVLSAQVKDTVLANDTLVVTDTGMVNVDSAEWVDEYGAPSPDVDLDVRGGVAFPTARLNDYTGVGYAVGAGAALWVTDHVALRLDGDVDAMPGDDGLPNVESGMPDMNFYRLSGGLQIDAVGKDSPSPWSFDATVGAGETLLDTPDFVNTVRTAQDVTETYPHVLAGVTLGYEANDNIDISVGSRGFVTFTDAHDLQQIQELSPAARPLDHTNIIPVTAMITMVF